MKTLARRFTVSAFVATAALLIAGCAPAAPETAASDAAASSTTTVEAAELLAPLGLESYDGRAVIDALEAMPVAERPTHLIASVHADELLLKDDAGREASMPLPQDEFYTSIAPFVNQTHDCYFHSLTTCQGELALTDLTVKIVSADGTVILNEAVTTNDNGFVGLWLPRDLDATITIEHDDLSVTSALTTGAEDATCVTTLQLT